MPFTPLEQAGAAARVRQTRWARYFVRHSKKTCALALLFPLVAIAIIVVSRSFTLDDPNGEDYFVRDDIRTRLDDAREGARDKYPFDVAQAQRADERDAFAMEILLRSTIDGVVPAHDNADRAPNVLTRQALAMLKRAEDAIFTDPEFTRFCLYDPQARDCNGLIPTCVLPSSILNNENLYGEYKEGRLCGRSNGTDPVSEDDFKNFIESLTTNSDDSPEGGRIINSDVSGFLTITTDADNPETWAVRSRLRVGKPFEGFQSADDDITEQEEAYDEWVSGARDAVEEIATEEVDLFLVGIQLSNAAFGDIALRDLSFSAAALVLVFILIWIHTGSAFLSSTAMAQIFLSFPLAYVFYRLVFQQLYFAALQILAIFLLLGIGADDVFVFTDAWKQAAVVLGKDCDHVTRMSWTYRRAVKAMSVTSFTTACAFFVTATSPIMPVGTLGVWAGLLIIFQFLLVITVYPCAVAIWERFWRQRLFVRGFKRPAPEEAEYELNLPFYQRFLPKKWRSKPEDLAHSDYRPIERFFRGPWLRLLFKALYVLVVIAAALAGVSIYLATRLEPPTETEEFLPASHPLAVAFDTLAEAFPTTQADQQLRVRITWGILDVDREGTSKFEPSDPGKAVLDGQFDLRIAAAQRHLLDACESFESNEDLIFEGDTIDETVRCWIRDYRNWRIGQGSGEFVTFDTHEELAAELISFANFTDEEELQPHLKYLQGQDIAFNNDKSRLVFTELRYVSSTEAAVPESVMWPVYQRWQALLAEVNGGAPEGMNLAIATGGNPWKWQITQRTLVRSMFVGIGVMLAVALAALTITTMNWVISIITTLIIGGIVAMQIGLISLLGWELGITETVGVVISIGYSFDGAAHIATAYVESNSDSRYDRTRDALTDLGISILFGALSTLTAGIMLFPAIITFFVKFAGLIVITVSLSLIWSLTFLPSLLLIVGPTGKFGSIAPLFRKIAQCFCCFKKQQRRDNFAVNDDIKAEAETATDQNEIPGERSALSDESSSQ